MRQGAAVCKGSVGRERSHLAGSEGAIVVIGITVHTAIHLAGVVGTDHDGVIATGHIRDGAVGHAVVPAVLIVVVKAGIDAVAITFDALAGLAGDDETEDVIAFCVFAGVVDSVVIHQAHVLSAISIHIPAYPYIARECV